MGKKHSKLEAVIGSSYTCPSCQEIFNADTPSKQVNEHIINCSHSPTSLSSDDLFNPINLKSSKKKTISNKNSKLDPLRIKDYIKTRKINWLDGCDTIKISRDNCLEESVWKNRLNKLNLLIYGEKSKLNLKERCHMMLVDCLENGLLY